MSERAPYLAIVGTHGPPEATGPALYELFQANPVKGWEVVYGDTLAAAAGRRSADVNLSLAYGRADSSSSCFGYRRAAELLELTLGRELVIDIHDTPNAIGRYAMLGVGAESSTLGFAALFGMSDIVIQTDPAWLYYHRPEAIILEMCRNEAAGDQQCVEANAWGLIEDMQAVAEGGRVRLDLDDFNFHLGVGEYDEGQIVEAGIDKTIRLGPFDALPLQIAGALGLDCRRKYVVEYWNSQCSSGASYGGIFQVETPSSSQRSLYEADNVEAYNADSRRLKIVG